jgi:hypothetical protein
VGVVSLTDVVRCAAGEDSQSRLSKPVREIMNDDVYFVRPAAPINNVIGDLLSGDVKRLFVVDENGVLVGVISVIDVLRYLNAEAAHRPRPAVYVPRGRPTPPLPRRSAPFAATPRTGSDIIMAGVAQNGRRDGARKARRTNDR